LGEFLIFERLIQRRTMGKPDERVQIASKHHVSN
jgi:hypothetical protein